MLETDKAYAAGLIDGEGSICAVPTASPVYFRVFVQIGMCDRTPLDWLTANFGGNVHMQTRRTSGGKQVFIWNLNAKSAAPFLSSIVPYLKIKQARALNAIALVNLSHPRGGPRITEDEIAQRLKLVNAIRT